MDEYITKLVYHVMQFKRASDTSKQKEELTSEDNDLNVIKYVRNRLHSTLIEDFDDDNINCKCNQLTLYDLEKNDTLQNLYSKNEMCLSFRFSIRKNLNYSRIETDGYYEFKKIATELFNTIASTNNTEE